MKISKKTDYAFRVLTTLAEHYGQKPIPIRELAARNAIPKPFLEHIMLELKSQGWVTSLPGKTGGYVLAKSPEEICMGQIVRYFDDFLSPESCAPTNEKPYHFRQVFVDVRNEITRKMDNTSLAVACGGQALFLREIISSTQRM